MEFCGNVDSAALNQSFKSGILMTSFMKRHRGEVEGVLNTCDLIKLQASKLALVSKSFELRKKLKVCRPFLKLFIILKKLSTLKKSQSSQKTKKFEFIESRKEFS